MYCSWWIQNDGSERRNIVIDRRRVERPPQIQVAMQSSTSQILFFGFSHVILKSTKDQLIAANESAAKQKSKTERRQRYSIQQTTPMESMSYAGQVKKNSSA